MIDCVVKKRYERGKSGVMMMIKFSSMGGVKMLMRSFWFFGVFFIVFSSRKLRILFKFNFLKIVRYFFIEGIEVGVGIDVKLEDDFFLNEKGKKCVDMFFLERKFWMKVLSSVVEKRFG